MQAKRWPQARHKVSGAKPRRLRNSSVCSLASKVRFIASTTGGDSQRPRDGGVHAVEDVCSHEEYPLSEGWIEDHTIECALHGSRFDLLTGEPDSPPALRPVRIFPVRVEGEDVLVDLPDDWAKLAQDL